ncbi:hypothetical protein, partial [Staphylococcus borealis]
KLGVGAPAKRISSRNSTSKASWESGPQQREFHQEILQAKQAGVTTNSKRTLSHSLHSGDGGSSLKRLFINVKTYINVVITMLILLIKVSAKY